MRITIPTPNQERRIVDTIGGNYGKGQRTSMSDALGSNSITDKYDNRGRLIQESKTIDSNTYTTQYSYYGTDQIYQVTYPSGEVVTENLNGRGLPYSLSGTTAGNLVTGTLYNGLGAMTELNLNNGARSSYGYYGTGGSYDTTGGYYGKLWEIKTVKSGNNSIQDVKHTWDAAGNLSQRQDLVSSETETFSYDFLDRLTGVSGAYSQSYSYDQLGNITAMNGNSYSYGSKPHAVTTVGSASYAYDSNGNMTTRGSQTLTWDAENRPVTVTGGASFVYDGDGNRVKKIEGGVTTVYPNKYYEKNTTSGIVTTHYFLGNQQIAVVNAGTLNYVQQDSLGGTTVSSDTSGNSIGTIRYLPFGDCRISSGSIPTDEKFTGQRLDSTGLYYYGAGYYDATIGRFISPDTMVPDPANPQSLNRYAYSSNNPLKYIDPSRHEVDIYGIDVNIFETYGFDDAAAMLGATGQDYWNMGAMWSGYSMFSQVAPGMTLPLEASTEKTVNLEFGQVNGNAVAQTLPANYIQAAGDVISGNGANIDYKITVSPGMAGSPDLAQIVAHEFWHGNDPNLSDSVQEELRAYQFQDSVAHVLHPSESHNSFNLRSLDPSTQIGLTQARENLNQ